MYLNAGGNAATHRARYTITKNNPLHLLPTLKYSLFLLSLIEQLAALVCDPDILPKLGLTPTKIALPSKEGVSPHRANFAWMWKFFAEHPSKSTKLSESPRRTLPCCSAWTRQEVCVSDWRLMPN